MKHLLCVVAIAALSHSLVACRMGLAPPSEWADGGAPMQIPDAMWEISKEDRIVIYSNGMVSWNGRHVLTVDHRGRVSAELLPGEQWPFQYGSTESAARDASDIQTKPYALMMPDGRLIGPNDSLWGVIEVSKAWLKEDASVWISIGPSGEVAYYDGEDEEEAPVFAGTWRGCGVTPWTQWTCTLVTYLFRVSNKLASNSMRARGNMDALKHGR
ncbi:hypothetical protein [Sorangium sp. So ce131]|uniref:hypothetical protein n=1 Tax=Sorangium sp. So ce131 TaxID=3133282 RepID=UPI003F5F1481